MLPILTRAHQALQSKKYSEVLELLSRLDLSSLCESDLGTYSLLYAEACLWSGNYAVEDHIDKALSAFRRSSDTDSFAQAKYLRGWWLSLRGQHLEAVEVLLECLAHFKRCEDLRGVAKALNRLSYEGMLTGKPDNAIENLQSTLIIYDQLGDGASKLRAAQNLARLLLVYGRVRESLLIYKQHPVPVDFSDEKAALNYCYWSAAPLALQGNFAEAHQRLAGCPPALLSQFPREHANFLEYSGWVALLDGGYAKAESTLKEGLELSLKIAPESALISQIKRLLGDVCLATNRYAEAAQYAVEANEVAVKIGEKVEIAACLRIHARIAQHDGKLDRAAELYKEAIDLFSQISSRYELAVTRYLAAQSNCYGRSESIALLYLAREYFDSEEVAPYIEKVKRALVQLDKEPDTAPSRPIKSTTAIITKNPTVLRALEFARKVAPSTMNVLITGDTGTGKDLLARYVHDYSGRTGEFITVNIAALPSTMAEAELFGYAKGAYTGAGNDKPGLLELADNGTFFLNEIGEASPEVQSKLLEVIESKMIRRLGDVKQRRVDFRLIAATNQNLEQKMRDGHFRTDLYHRLNQIPLRLTPLAERPEDFGPLTEHFLKLQGWQPNGDAALVARLIETLRRSEWPGNIRELESFISSLYLQAEGSLAAMIEIAEDSNALADDGKIEMALVDCGGNKSKAARQLGIHESTLRYYLKKRD